MSQYKDLMTEGYIDAFLVKLVSIFSKNESITDHLPGLASLAKTDKSLAGAIKDLDDSVKDMRSFLVRYRQLNPEMAAKLDKVPSTYIK